MAHAAGPPGAYPARRHPRPAAHAAVGSRARDPALRRRVPAAARARPRRRSSRRRRRRHSLLGEAHRRGLVSASTAEPPRRATIRSASTSTARPCSSTPQIRRRRSSFRSGPSLRTVAIVVPPDVLFPSVLVRVLRRFEPRLIARQQHDVVFAPNFLVPAKLRRSTRRPGGDGARPRRPPRGVESRRSHARGARARPRSESGAGRGGDHAVARGGGGAGGGRTGKGGGGDRDPSRAGSGRERRAGGRGRSEVPERYALFVGTLEPRKNLELLLELWPRLRRDHRDWPALVVCGGWGWKTESMRERVDSPSARAGSIRSATSATRRCSRSIAARGSWCSPRSTRGSVCRCSRRWRWAARWCAAICRCSAKWRATRPSTRRPVSPRPGSRLCCASRPTPIVERSCRRLGLERAAAFDWERSVSETLEVWRVAAGRAVARRCAAGPARKCGAASPRPTSALMRIVRPLVVALVAAALAAHVAYWYLPRERTATVDAASPAGALFAGGDQAVRAWLAYPHQNVGAAAKAMDDPAAAIAAAARLAGLGDLSLPGVRAVRPAAVRRAGDRGRARRRTARRHRRGLSGGRGPGAHRWVDRRTTRSFAADPTIVSGRQMSVTWRAAPGLGRERRAGAAGVANGSGRGRARLRRARRASGCGRARDVSPAPRGRRSGAGVERRRGAIAGRRAGRAAARATRISRCSPCAPHGPTR